MMRIPTGSTSNFRPRAHSINLNENHPLYQAIKNNSLSAPQQQLAETLQRKSPGAFLILANAVSSESLAEVQSSIARVLQNLVKSGTFTESGQLAEGENPFLLERKIKSATLELKTKPISEIHTDSNTFKKAIEALTPTTSHHFELSGDKQKKLFTQKSPLKTEKDDYSGKMRTLEYGESPFTKGSINEADQIMRGGVAFGVTKRTRASEQTNQIKTETNYFAKRMIQTSIEAINFTTRAGKIENPKSHYALAEVTGGLAYQRFFGEDFTPKSRLIANEKNTELMVGSKIIPDLKTLNDIEESLKIPSFNPNLKTDQSNRGRCIEISTEGQAKIIKSDALTYDIDGSDVDFQGKIIQGLGDYAAATWFLGERDTNLGNIGLPN